MRQHDQYLVRVDGSGRLTLRNRKFLRKYVPVFHPEPRRSIVDDMARPIPRPPAVPLEKQCHEPILHKITTEMNRGQPVVPARRPTPDAPPQPTLPAAEAPADPPPAHTPAAPPVTGPRMPQPTPRDPPPADAPNLRRSSRIKRPPEWTKDYVK